MYDLGDAGFVDGKRIASMRLVDVFHAGMDETDKNRVMDQIAQPESVIRLVICTVAFGIGVNIPDIRIIFHWGSCSNILEYWQEVGRAGRDGEPAEAYYFATKRSLVHCDEDMKHMCESLQKGTCMRQIILQSLQLKQAAVSKELVVNCCTFCKQ